MNVDKVFSEVAEHADRIANDGEHSPAMDIGDVWPQGDIGLLRLASVPNGATKAKAPSNQLAPGSTQGSRHCIAALSGVTIYQIPNATVLDGPIIDAPKGCRIDHPEHGDVILPAGVYGVVYQRAFAEELRRVAD